MIRILAADDPEIFKHSAKDVDEDSIESIIQDVRQGGDAAVTKYDVKFGGVHAPLRLERRQIENAYTAIKPGIKRAISEMIQKLKETEQALLDALRSTPDRHGITRTFPPIPSVGCYVPGGQAHYPSSAVMSVVPAAVAGVERIVVVSPSRDKSMDASTIVAADMCGAHEIYRTGGAQAVAALAYGTESIRGVDKIVGPGGAAVTAAKRIVSRDVPIDMQAGPTELGILADGGADSRLISLDLISQAEHGADTQCFLLTDSASLAEAVSKGIEQRLDSVMRSEIVRASLYRNGFIAVCDSMEKARNLASSLAPEHLQVMTKDADEDAARIRTAGLTLLGDTPSAASDYLLGSNHILPTGGQGRVRGQLSVLDFVKVNTQVRAGDMRSIISSMKHITDAEGLSNHFEAVRGRIS